MVSKEEQDRMVEQIVDFRCFIAGTLEWRKEQGDKMTRLIEDVEKLSVKFEKLPCRERAWIPMNIYALWGVVGTIGLAVFIEWIKN
jgi:hypothetical protein